MKYKTSPLALTFRAEPTPGYDGSVSADMVQGGMMVPDLVFAYLGDECVADFQIEKRPDGWRLHSAVDANWRRQGIATAIYDMVEAQAAEAGIALLPSDFQTNDAQAFWRNRQDRAALARRDAGEAVAAVGAKLRGRKGVAGDGLVETRAKPC
jgi:GNAT superfamily N-acetyltransferase